MKSLFRRNISISAKRHSWNSHAKHIIAIPRCRKEKVIMDKTEDNGLYVLTSTKGIETAMKDLDDAIKKHNFSTLQVYDLKKKLSDKGFPLPSECRVVELCNPKQAAAVLSTQMLVSTALPCRISVFEEGGMWFTFFFFFCH